MLINEDEYLYYVDQALDGMAQILSGLGDELANRQPALPGANSPYAIVTHCLGVLDYWLGMRVAGRVVERDREAEFRASGAVLPLVERVDAAKRQLRADLTLADTGAPLRPGGRPSSRPDLSQGGALIQVYKELAQHHGQLELTRDVLVATSDPTPSP